MVERHLEDCLLCSREYQFEIRLLNGIRERLRRISLPTGLLESIRLRLDAEVRRQ